MKSKIKLGVNIDHAATLRQVRGGTTSYPNMLDIVQEAVKGGADQITIHLREDRRHIQEQDLALLAEKCPVSLNLEMAATEEMVRKALKYRPEWVCFVPEKRQELTTEGGLDVARAAKKIARMVARLQRIGMEASMFIEPSRKQVKASYDVGADAVEFHTGKWVRLQGQARKKEWKRLVDACQYAHQLGLKVHAGHGLDFQSSRQIRRLPFLREVNIGHSLICYSLTMGLKSAVQEIKKCLK